MRRGFVQGRSKVAQTLLVVLSCGLVGVARQARAADEPPETSAAPNTTDSEDEWRFMAYTGLGLHIRDGVDFSSTLGVGVARETPVFHALTLDLSIPTDPTAYFVDARVHVGYAEEHEGFSVAPFVGGTLGGAPGITAYGITAGLRCAAAFRVGQSSPATYGWSLGPYLDGGARILWEDVTGAARANGYAHAGIQVRYH